MFRHQETSYCSGADTGVTALALTYVLSLSLFFFYVRVLLIDFHYLSVFCRALFITHHLIILIVLLVVVYYTFDSFSLHHAHCSSSSWLLLSVTYTFISAHLSCAHCLLGVHSFIQYIRGSYSPTIHHIIISSFATLLWHLG